jgi:uncharacterized pyridoxal phosphate-containing UPF0001 family protein
VLAAAGHRRLGGNRVQSLVGKTAELAGSRSVPRAATALADPLGPDRQPAAQQGGAGVALIGASTRLDRDEILRWLDRLAANQDARCAAPAGQLSGRGSKHGYRRPSAAGPRWRPLPNLTVEGFMTMAPRGTDHETSRPAFAALRELRDRLAPRLLHLSMGMSQDWRGAILEGATILRVGSALFAAPE